MIEIRKAAISDRKQIAYCIAEAFEKDFSILSKEIQTVANAIESCIKIERFYVAIEDGNDVVGALAISDCTGRSFSTDSKSYKKHFGFIKGILASMVMKGEFEKPLSYPKTVGFIEFVCVLKRCQRKGITTMMLDFALKDSGYDDYELDVTDVNHGAYKCYQKFGFTEYKREPVKHAKQKGFNEKIYMKYHAKANKQAHDQAQAQQCEHNHYIRRMTQEDIELVIAMEREVFSVDNWPIEWFYEGVNDPDGYYYMAYIGDTLVGYCGMYNINSITPNYCKIATLAVKQEFRQKGIGKELMLKMLDTAKELGLDRTKLEVNTKNGAIKLYEALGFKIEELKEGYFEKSGDDAYIMWRYESENN